MNNFLFINQTMYYFITAVLVGFVLLGLHLLSKVEKAKLGNIISATAIFIAIIVTLLMQDVFQGKFWFIFIAIAIGLLIGLIWAKRVNMIDMPQLVAILNGIGGTASAIIGGLAYMGISGDADANVFSVITSLIAITIGMTTLFGSLVAAGKLHKVLSQKPVVLPKHQLITISLLLLMVASIVIGALVSGNEKLFVLVFAILVASLFGLVFTIRVGGADMPITISLLNSFSGVAGAIAGLAINDLLLVAIGGVVGASGLLLTQIMCRAMNRNLFEILLGKTTTQKKGEEEIIEKDENQDDFDTIKILKSAKKVIIVPGYGMAIAQAQHLVKTLADKLTSYGAEVKYAIHPVAGRMPGHMNVLLCEADVDYDDLVEMDEINEDFATADLTIVIGANDVLNPKARDDESTPIYGMPILNVDQCKSILFFNYDLQPGYAGVENPLYMRKEGIGLVLGNAADTLEKVLKKLN